MVNTKNGDFFMKRYTLITIITIGIILGFLTGIYIYKIKQIKSNNTEGIAELIEDECTYIAQLGSKDEILTANAKKEKTSPNCVLILKMYYQKCGHIIEKKEKIEEANVNLTEKELKEKFPDWEVQKFTETEIVLYKEINDFCNEHYILKEKDGYIAIYKLDENKNEELMETTNISTGYLEEEDLKKIKEGLFINTRKELNKTLEDYE